MDKASQNGVLVATCDATFLRLVPLQRDPNGDPDDPARYPMPGRSGPGAALCVPSSNRTIASHSGSDIYTYWTTRSMSWTVPYLAGLAAPAFQIDPEIKPAQIIELWTVTAARTSVGPIVNPPKFIEAVQSRANKKAP